MSDVELDIVCFEGCGCSCLIDQVVRLQARSTELERERDGANAVLDLWEAPTTVRNPYDGTDDAYTLSGRLHAVVDPENQGETPKAIRAERDRLREALIEIKWELRGSVTNTDACYPNVLRAYRVARRALAVEPGQQPGNLDADYPLMWEVATAYDRSARLGEYTTPLQAEIDKALHELWSARQARPAVQPAAVEPGQGKDSAKTDEVEPNG